MRQHLDLAAVEAFVLVAELHSFTRASEALGMTQAGVSAQVRRLEAAMGRRLIDRTPRHVRLSTEGEAFLPLAQDLLAAQQSALEGVKVPGRELNIAISDHVAGPELPQIIARVNAHDPGLLLKVRVDFSSQVRKAFEQGDLDVAVIRQGARRDGDVLFEDCYGWYASSSARLAGKALPLITVVETCGVRALAIRLLVRSNVPWVDAFRGGGVATAISAAAAGIGVLPLPRRLATAGLVDVGEALGLPALPPAKVAMLARSVDGATKGTVRTLRSAFRASVGCR